MVSLQAVAVRCGSVVIASVVLSLFIAALSGPLAEQSRSSACSSGICTPMQHVASTNRVPDIQAYDVSVRYERVAAEGDDIGLMAYSVAKAGTDQPLHAPLEPPLLSVRPGNVLELRIRNELPPNRAPPPVVEALLDADAKSYVDEASIAAAAAVAWSDCWSGLSGSSDAAGGPAARSLLTAFQSALAERRLSPQHQEHQQHPELLPHRYANNPHGFRSTNLHAHGLQVSPQEDDAFAHIEPGKSTVRRLAIPGDHPSGLHWLHPHSHASAAVQLSQGMAALVRVEGELDALMRSLGIREVILPVTELTLQRLDRLSQGDIDAAVARRNAARAAASAAAEAPLLLPSSVAATATDASATSPSPAPSREPIPTPTASPTPAVDFFTGGGQGTEGSGQWSGGLFGWDPVPLACPSDGGVRWDEFEWHALLTAGRIAAIERRLDGDNSSSFAGRSSNRRRSTGINRDSSVDRGHPDSGFRSVGGQSDSSQPRRRLHVSVGAVSSAEAASSAAPHALRRAQSSPSPYPSVDRDDPHDFRAGNLLFTGRQPVVEARYGELLWLRVVNGAPARPLVVTLDDATSRWAMFLLAVDGITLPQPVRLLQGLTFAWGVDIEGGVLLPPGGRFDLLVQTPGAPRPQPSLEPPPWALASKSPTASRGTSPIPPPSPFPTMPPPPRPVREVVSLWSSRYVGCTNMADCPDYPAFLIASIRMPHPTEATGEALALPSPMPLPENLPTPTSPHMAPIAAADVSVRRVFVMSQRMPHASAADLAAAQGPAKRDGDAAALDHVGFYINNATYDPHRVDVRVAFGAVEEWIVENPAPAHDHPWHVHGTPFLVVALQDMGTGRDVLVQPYWADTVWVPLGMRVVTRLRFSRFRGRSVAHCHIASHESSGMMITYEVE